MNNYECKFCHREYKEKFNYDRHVGFCEFSYKTRKEIDNEIESFEKVPSQLELFRYVKELSLRIDKLENDNAKLRLFANQQKKKIDIVEWLNERSQIVPPITFCEWFNALPILEELQTVFEYDLIKGMTNCLEKGVNGVSIDDYDDLPFSAFTQKSNTFYVYDKNEAGETSWKTITNKQFDKFIKMIANKFIAHFKNWHDQNKDLIDSNEKEKEKYYYYCEKVLGGKMSDETICLRIRKTIHEKIRKDLKNIIEFEFS
jgi:hypothetical protein